MRISDWSSDVCSSDLRPHSDMIGARARRAELAPAVIGVLLMMRLKRREEVEFEGDARMPRRHDAVGDELPLARRSEMAVDAHPRAHHRVFKLAKARAQMGEMLLAHLGIGVGGGADPGIMAGDPAAGGAVTRFARHPTPDRQEERRGG